MKKRPSITLLTVLLAMVFAAGIGVYSSYIGMKIYQESSDHLLESFSQISETFTLFVQRNWTVLSQWDGLLKNADIDHADSIGADMQANKESWHYSDFYLFNESTQYLTADGRRGSADSLSGVIQEMYSEGGPIVSTYTASYGVPKIAFAMPLSRNMTLDGVTYTGLAVSYDTDVVDDLVDGSMYGGQSDCYIVRANGDIVLRARAADRAVRGHDQSVRHRRARRMEIRQHGRHQGLRPARQERERAVHLSGRAELSGRDPDRFSGLDARRHHPR